MTLTPLLILMGYLVVGGFFAVYQWLVLMIQIQALAMSLGDLYPEERKASFLAKVFNADIGCENLDTPPNPMQFIYRIGRWIMFWPFYVGVHVRRTIRAGLKK